MNRKRDIYTVLIFLLLIGGFAVAFLALPDRAFSPQENRGLQTLPSISAAGWISGDYADRCDDYFADQFPARDLLVGLKCRCELALGKGENDGILRGRDGYLARVLFDARTRDGRTLSDVDCVDMRQIQASCEALTRTRDALKIPFEILLTGRTIDVCASSFAYPRENSDRLLDAVQSGLGDNTLTVEAVKSLRARHDADEYVYYRTDHHWTTRGAYYAYVHLMRSFGMENAVIPEGAFEKRVVADDFYGTAWSAGGMRQVPPDEIEIWSLGNEDSFCVTADGRAINGFYSPAYLAGKDKYSFFLDGTHDVVTVTKNTDEARPRLLILKDSFANTIVPFLAQHFDLVLLNLSSVRSDFTNLSGAVEEYDADFAALIYTLENMITADRLTRLH